MSDDQAREGRLRRLANRQDCRLVKSRRRDPHAVDYGRWYIVDVPYNVVLWQCDSLDEVEDRLTDEN